MSDWSRRRFLGALAAGVLPLPGVAPALPQSQRGDSLAGGGPTGTLMDPSVAGRPRQPTAPGENDAEIKAIEQKLACTCGCTLDVFTCRTTDFTCTYSPDLHREVLALRAEGKTAQEILDAFVERYGEKALMAPMPRGFNLWGYLLPGIAVGGGAVALAALLRRRETVAARAGVPEASAEPPVSATPDEMDRLRRALQEVED